MVQRQKRLTKREKKAASPGGHHHDERHIHCLACGRHLDPNEFTDTPQTAVYLTCQHGSRFASCTACEVETRSRLAEHDRTGQPPRVAGAWH
jgi:hypothetical protein